MIVRHRLRQRAGLGMIGMALGAARAFLAPLLRAVPWWAWLAIALAAWGAWQRHSATVATRQAEQMG